MSSACVLVRNTSNNFNHILTQFRKQTYVNKNLIVFDTLNVEKPTQLSQNVIYVNPEADLKMEQSKIETETQTVRKNLNEVMDILDKKLRYKTELEKSIEKLKSKLTMEMESDAPSTKTQKEVEKQTMAYDVLLKEISESNSTKSSFESQLKTLLSSLMDLEKKTSSPKEAYSMDECKNIAVSKYNADVCIFMDDHSFYDAHYINIVIKELENRNADVLWCSKIHVLDNKKRLTNRISTSLKNMPYNPTFSCTKELGTISDDVQISEGISSTLCLVKLTEATKNLPTAYNKVNIEYSYNKHKILKIFQV
jgi:septation ring formation regulator EzrA